MLCSLPFPQVLSVQMCDVVHEIELERERCENRAGNVTAGKSRKSCLTVCVSRRLFKADVRLHCLG